ncbi:FecR family protein|uniref:FecR family protein n=1 Tax=Brenneria salicis ATCC 15712 = DSM 30166 TaxID=714314 RepID=A0A366I4C2_9GAMM|nr:FecR family protein [Brenneria salicis]NMN91899.1 FecR family protein [Brenneria salicis ATCC 15712 = DSM 30166]RBP62883.1 FecR family protein [Brenneria salicis ATCC 15712 = DSM 30166]
MAYWQAVNSIGSNPIQSNEKEKQAQQDAIDWLIALQEDPNDTDVLARFNAWRDSSEENQRAWLEAQHVWNLLDETRHTPNLHTRTARFTPPPHPVASQRWRVDLRRLALSAAAAVVCLAVLLQPAINQWLAADYATGIAETRQIRLDDGSTVCLGADSAIKVTFEPRSRQVILLSGEAYFDVQPDTARPFHVAAGTVDTTVLGTAFDVRLMADSVMVAVNHGRVAVAAPEAQPRIGAPLQAGDWVRIAKNGQVERGQDAPELVGGWRAGMLIVKDRPIADVVEEIRRHYRGAILLTDSTLAQQRVTGAYDLNAPVDALRALAQAHGGNARQISPWVTVISTR